MKFMIRLAAAAAAAAALAAVLGACASSSPAPVLLTLPPAAATAVAAAPPGAAGSAPILAVRRVNVPEYLVARRVRYRADPSTLAEWPNTYWAERVEIGVSREFVSALRAQLPGWSLCDISCGDQIPTLALQIDLVPMDYLRSAQKLQARARITVSDGSTPPRVLRTQELPYELAASADTAQAQSQAIADLIQQVAQATAPMIKEARP
jgi:uncharacterized lipoprotein YmbA